MSNKDIQMKAEWKVFKSIQKNEKNEIKSIV